MLLELYCLERGIQPDGQMPSDKTVGEECFPSPPSSVRPELENTPRAVFVDLDPTVIDEVPRGPTASCSTLALITGKELPNPLRPWTLHHRKDIIDLVMDRIHKLGFLVSQLRRGHRLWFHLPADGGLSSTTARSPSWSSPSTQLPRCPRLWWSLKRNPDTHTTLEHSDCAFRVDNEAITILP
ncbi:hypothetical protein FQN60_002426 [Etheostoma spectabile]|uniref:Uncharacterized protein n=1 Tax=Etheostoma spectabile TaxID=54343 RepID=A0A5J5DD45_9PERO|nr:hypothetical protein FQN60_002426 [Etheostoma spectabile]